MKQKHINNHPQICQTIIPKSSKNHPKSTPNHPKIYRNNEKVAQETLLESQSEKGRFFKGNMFKMVSKWIKNRTKETQEALRDPQGAQRSQNYAPKNQHGPRMNLKWTENGAMNE